MKLTLKQAYRSIGTFIMPDSLPKFVVITGLNGSGKTHLLEAIDKGSIVAKTLDDQPINRIKFFDYKMLQPKDESIPPTQLDTERKVLWNIIQSQASQQRKQAQQQLSAEPEQPLDVAALKALYEELSDHHANAEVSDLDVKYQKAMDMKQQSLANLKAHCVNRLRGAGNEKPINQEAQVNKAIAERGSNSDDILDNLQQKTSLPLFLLDQSTFERLYDPFIAYDPFNRSYSMWFSRYMEEYYRNQTQAINRDLIGHDHITYKKDDEFKKLYGEFPWVSINRFFAKVGLPFTINAPEAGSQQPFKATITDDAGNVIKFDSFSSGEEIILSLVSALSYANENDSLSTLPDLLLLDEIDAPLHPSMTDFLLATLNESIVEDQGISVILTTHSPSTVAIAPEESLYELKKNSTKKTLEKISKDAAISLLTAGVPTLSVSYGNRRMVLVESKYDAEYYTLIDGLIRHQRRINNQEIQNELSLIFHSAGGTQKGGCELVKEHVEKFQGGGIRSICGVVDWDNGRNVKNPPLYVLGEKQGYSIETFLLDPLIVGTLLLHDELVSRASLSLPDQSSVNDILSSGQDRLQHFADTVLTKILRESDTKLECIERHYAGGFTLQLPLWFCHHEDGTNGHDLEDRYLEAIVPLKQKYNRRLKSKCIRRVLQNYHALMPVVFIDLMDELRAGVVLS